MNLNYRLLQYCKANIEDWGFLERRALKMIDHMRCPLQMASPELANKMEEKITEYLEDNKIDGENLGIDIDEVFWASEDLPA